MFDTSTIEIESTGNTHLLADYLLDACRPVSAHNLGEPASTPVPTQIRDTDAGTREIEIGADLSTGTPVTPSQTARATAPTDLLTEIDAHGLLGVHDHLERLVDFCLIGDEAGASRIGHELACLLGIDVTVFQHEDSERLSATITVDRDADDVLGVPEQYVESCEVDSSLQGGASA